MRKIKEVLRLKYHNKLSNRQIQTITGVSRNSVANYVNCFKGLSLPLEEVMGLSDNEMEKHFHPTKPSISQKSSSLTHPDWNAIREELTQKGMTRALLYEEYKRNQPSLYSYSQFNRYYYKYLTAINPSMRQVHYAGDKLFIDYSGLTVPIVNQHTGETTKAQIFVCVLGASGYTFVHATNSQSTKDFIRSHVLAFQFYGGVPNILVPDNLKAAVISHKKGVVKLNESYADMGRHYGVAIEPARPYKPQDKSKVELGVKAIQRWILMKLRHHIFFDVDELNQQIGLLLDGYNQKIIRRIGKSRAELFIALDKPALHPLRANTYIYKEFKTATVGVDYHVELEGSGYSVPFQYLGKKVDIIYSPTSVVIALQGEVIAHHPKLSHPYHDSTLVAHMPKEHEYQYEKWNPRRILHWASSIGPHTMALMQSIMDARSDHVRGYKACMAILSFSKTYGNEALEAAAGVAHELNIHKVASLESMLKTKSYRLHLGQAGSNNSAFTGSHNNIRGSAHYAQVAQTPKVKA